MNHDYANMWKSNDNTHNIMCSCHEVFTHKKIGTAVRMYTEHLVKEVQHA
jgi:hypothetical protein